MPLCSYTSIDIGAQISIWPRDGKGWIFIALKHEDLSRDSYVKIPNLRLDILIRTLAGWYREKKKKIIISIIFTPPKHIIPSNSYQLFWINISSFSVIVVAVPSCYATDILWVDFVILHFCWMAGFPTHFSYRWKTSKDESHNNSLDLRKNGKFVFFLNPIFPHHKGKIIPPPNQQNFHNFCCTNEKKLPFVCVCVCVKIEFEDFYCEKCSMISQLLKVREICVFLISTLPSSQLEKPEGKKEISKMSIAGKL